MARLPLIAGNWKMNGLGRGGQGLAGKGIDGLALAAAIKEGLAETALPSCELLVCPPFTLLSRVAALLAGSRVAVGGQDCHAEAKGAFTGDVSAEMLAEAGCRYVILGHSERRRLHGETSAAVRAKIEGARRAGLIPVLCVGETIEERLSGQAFAVVRRQLAESLPEGAAAAPLVVAYEPVWAIGSGRTPSAEEIAEMHGEIRAAVGDGAGGEGAPRILYGGSVDPAKAAGILALPEVGGALVGGASLEAESFLAIARACAAQ
jgi:triosephosphate isomerase